MSEAPEPSRGDGGPPSSHATAGSPGSGPGSPGSGPAAGSGPAHPAIDRSLPPDPAAYDSERASLARARGLSAPYIAGGRDPDPEAGRREERFLGRLLAVMVLVIILGGFLLGIIDNVITTLRGG
jgi:hypothetical protein